MLGRLLRLKLSLRLLKMGRELLRVLLRPLGIVGLGMEGWKKLRLLLLLMLLGVELTLGLVSSRVERVGRESMLDGRVVGGRRRISRRVMFGRKGEESLLTEGLLKMAGWG
jgi:hypothetical protein